MKSGTLFVCSVMVFAAHAQNWDPGARLADAVSEGTDKKVKVSFEERGRYEDRTGNAFGKDPDRETGLFRTRLGLTYTPLKWLRVSAMVQDARSPWYEANPPNTVREEADLQEGY